MTTSSKRRRPRGYLLIETMLSGAIIAIILGAAMSVVASERADASRATLRAKAGALAAESLQQLMADNGAAQSWTCTSCPTAADGTCSSVPGWGAWSAVDSDGLSSLNKSEYPGFTRQWRCREIARSASALVGALVEVAVKIEYPAVGSRSLKDSVEHMATRRDRLLSR